MRSLVAMPLLASATLLLAGCTQILPEESTDSTAEESAELPTNQTEDTAGGEESPESPTVASPTPETPSEPPADPLFPVTETTTSSTPIAEPPAPAEPAAEPAPAQRAPATPSLTLPPPSPAPEPAAPAPQPEPARPAPAQTSAWPQEGSYVTYRFRTHSGSPDGSYSQHEDGRVTWTYRDGDWTGVCTWERDEFVQDRGWENTTGTETLTASSPPHWPVFNTKTPPAQGQRVETWYVDGCSPVVQDFMLYAGTDTESATVRGGAVQAATFVAEDSNDGSPSDFRSEWSRGTGLVLYWEWQRSYSNLSGRLVDTDAPLG